MERKQWRQSSKGQAPSQKFQKQKNAQRHMRQKQTRKEFKQMPYVSTSGAGGGTTTLSDIMAALAPKPTMERKSLVVYQDLSDDNLIQVRKDTKEEKPQFVDVPAVKKEHNAVVVNNPELMGLLKGSIFKADQPYRTKLHYHSSTNTSAAGVVNTLISVNTVSSCSEWSAIDVLFDEFFVHSMTLRWFALNDLGKGIGQSATPSAINSGGISNTTITNAQLVMCSLFNGAPVYSASGALANSATKAYHNSGSQFKYVWRNNVRFDKHGIAIVFTNAQGWITINNATNMGGQVQIRTVNDVTLGNLSAVVQMATIDLEFDVSFRARG